MNKLIVFSIFLGMVVSCPNDEKCASCEDKKCLLCYESFSNDLGLC